jgi:hypothetical protein
MMPDIKLAEIAFDAFHKGCNEFCHMKGQFHKLEKNAIQAWIDSSKAVAEAVANELSGGK